MESVELLRSLSDAFGVSGFEGEVRELIRRLIEPYVDELKVDPLGNLIATRRGKSDFKLMLDAHMDEVGLMISYIEDEGYLRFATIGSWDERIIPAQAVTIQTRAGAKVRGVIGSAPPHILKREELERPLKLEEMFIDIGASSRAEVEERGGPDWRPSGDPLPLRAAQRALPSREGPGRPGRVCRAHRDPQEFGG